MCNFLICHERTKTRWSGPFKILAIYSGIHNIHISCDSLFFFFVKGSHPTEIEKTSSGVKTMSTDSFKVLVYFWLQALALAVLNVVIFSSHPTEIEKDSSGVKNIFTDSHQSTYSYVFRMQALAFAVLKVS